MPRALIFDIDGTLIVRSAHPGVATVAAIESCRARGLVCFVATARRPESARIALGPLGWLADSGVFHAGALGRCLATGFNADVAMPAELVAQVTAVCAEAEPGAWVGIHAGDGGAAFARDLPVRAFGEWGLTAAELRPYTEACAASACKIAVWRDDGAALDKLAERLRERFSTALTLHLLDRGAFLNIAAASVDKATMAARLLESHGMALADAIAFGDDLSDLELLRALAQRLRSLAAIRRWSPSPIMSPRVRSLMVSPGY